MPKYDSRGFVPPAPLARVRLRSLDDTTVVSDVPMLLDTGADVSLVPRVAVDELSLPTASTGEFALVGFDGSSSMAPAVDLEMIFCGKSFRGRYLVIDQDWGILGRNVLNLLSITYDGPQLVWRLEV